MNFTNRDDLIEYLYNEVDRDDEIAWQVYTKADVASNPGCDVEEITDERFDVVHRWLGDWDIVFGDDIFSADSFDEYT